MGQLTGEERDEVDDLVAAWRDQRPDLDVAPLQVLSRVSRLARHLDIARRGAFAAHGLESWEFDVLSALRRAGPPFQLTPGALLRATLVTSGTMTNRIDRLAPAGRPSRAPHPRPRPCRPSPTRATAAACSSPSPSGARPWWTRRSATSLSASTRCSPASATISGRGSPPCSAPRSSPS